jgi:hypothetical protein
MVKWGPIFMVLKPQYNFLITGSVPYMITNDVAVLQYADDTVMCLENDMVKAINVKLMLYIFEQMFGLNINFEKSEIILVGDNNLVVAYAEVFNCQIGLFSIKYLGVPVS